MARNIISNDGTQEKVEQLIDDLDAERMESLLNAQEYQQIKNRQLESEMLRLTEKYNGTDSTRLQKIIARLEYNKSFFEAMDLNIALTKSMAAQEFDPVDWSVQGVVSDDKNMAVSSAIVQLASKGKELSNNNRPFSAVTDANGYYSITIAGDYLGNPKDIKLALQVLDAKSNLLFQDPRVLTPAAGIIDIENIVISAQQTVPLKKFTKRGR